MFPKSIRPLFIWSNIALVALLLGAVLRDTKSGWKKYQRAYYRLQNLEKAPSLEIKQIIVKKLDRIDRCITCHVGMDPLYNPSLTNNFKDNPHRGHPEIDLLKAHPVTKYGCSVCHQGQGLATTQEDAHGKVKHWEKPMLEAPYIQASCAKCHQNFDNLSYTVAVARGRELFVRNGCYGCHAIRGWGGTVSEDLGEIADKPLARIDFSTTGLPRNAWSIKNWIYLHLTKDPAQLAPGDPEGHLGEAIAPSGMPPFYLEFKDEDAQALTSYLLSLTAETIPHDYFVYKAPRPEPKFSSSVEHGKFVFQKYGCAGCHGIEAKEGRRNFNALGPNQTQMADGRVPNLRDTVGTFTKEELITKIQMGVVAAGVSKFKADGPVPPLYMPAWKEKIKGQELEDLVNYLFSIAKKQEEW